MHLVIYTADADSYRRLESFANANWDTFDVRFPERSGNATDSVRQVIRALISANKRGENTVRVVTAYPHVIMQVGEWVELDYVTSAITYVVRSDGSVTAHPYDDDGALTNNWPYGCLDVDSDSLTSLTAQLRTTPYNVNAWTHVELQAAADVMHDYYNLNVSDSLLKAVLLTKPRLAREIATGGIRDTCQRELLGDAILSYVGVSAWPAYGDTDEYKRTFNQQLVACIANRDDISFAEEPNNV